jgi:predicted SprT family Zn-dependent metalloprotease
MTAFTEIGGQPLPTNVRQKMESFFGASFADVRVHVGPQATSIGALAFTQGSHIHFAPGQYNPASPQGQQVLGHELAHVVQQRAGRVRNPFGSGVAVVQDRHLESEADQMGARAASHKTS